MMRRAAWKKSATTSSGTLRRVAPTTSLSRSKKACTSLSEHPQRGSYPKELLDIGIREFREVFFKPYRIIYRMTESDVYVLVIADGRRDMRALLERRLLQA